MKLLRALNQHRFADWGRLPGQEARLALALALVTTFQAAAQVPDNLVMDGIPPIPAELRAEVGRYLEFRTAAFTSWHPVRREMLVSTRFADAAQLHEVRRPGGARRQLTFTPEPVAGGAWQPRHGKYIVLAQDRGGGEFYQYYRLEPDTGRLTLLTDGQSRNGGARFARSGKWLAYTSTRRNGRDTDLYVMDPADRATDRLVVELSGGGWSVADWSPDETQLVVTEYLSINDTRLHRVEIKSGAMQRLTPESDEAVAYHNARFARDGKSIYFTTDREAEFHRLVRMELGTDHLEVLTPDLQWNVEEFELSPDGRMLAFITNEDGTGRLHLMDAGTGKTKHTPPLPLGIPSGLSWHENGRDLAFNFASARSPSDAYALDTHSGQWERWTESETGGLNPLGFVEPELIRIPSFDGLVVSGFLYRPDPTRFPGPRPLLVIIHGGPEGQSRPGFLAHNNYYVNELGVALLYPNVRGSDGYGKTFLTLDNGFRREDSVRDIGAFLDWAANDPGLDSDRIAVMGGSYGGYMTLASLVHHGDRLRCGVNVVGISSFLTFLKNTQDYRRDLRRVEYGDERDPAMAEFLDRISPLTSVARIRKPLLVVQGQNDPRVPVTEAEQIVQALRDNRGVAWYLMARDEGHGFRKKRNADVQFMTTVQFLREHLLN